MNQTKSLSESKIDKETLELEAISFLNMVAKELGFEINEESYWDAWELVDLIIKDIHLRKDNGRRIRAENKRLQKEISTLKHFDLFVQK